MPIYEYGCDECGGTFEYMQSVSDEPKTVCEQCGGKLKKLVSFTSFQLKGDGWYKDLYAKKPKPSPEAGGGAASSGDSSDTASPSKGAEAKPDAKTTKTTKTNKGD